MKNVLITGGAGFIGSNLSLMLIKKGYHVTVLDNLSPQIHGSRPKESSPLFQSILNTEIKFIQGSVRQKEDWKKALLGQDAIIHLAAETGTGQSMYEINKYVEVNIGGTALMLDFLTNEKHSVKKIVIASSRAIYGEGKYKCEKDGDVYPLQRLEKNMQNGDFECRCSICDGPVNLLPTDEESKIHPASIYGITKQTQEEMVLTVCKSMNIPSVVFRYQNVYGPGQSLSNPYTGILSIFSTQIKNNSNITIFEDGFEKRDFVYIDDVVNATILGLQSKVAEYQVFNVGANTPIDVLTVAKLLKKQYNSAIEIKVSGSYRLGDIRHNYADLSKIKSVLGYAPEYSFEEGLKRFCKWVNNQEIKEDRFSLSIEQMKTKGLYRQ